MARHVKNSILLIDDDPISLKFLSELLSDSYNIKVASSAKIALSILEQNPIDLILLDIYMPEIDGIEFAKTLQDNKVLSSIPIIFLTSSDDEETITNCFEVGGRDYITKPCKKMELFSRIKNHLNITKLYQDLQIYEEELEAQNEELKQNELVLTESKKEFEVLFKNAPICYVVLDEKLKIINYNNLALKYFNFPINLNISLNFLVFIKSKDYNDFFSLVNNEDYNAITIPCITRNKSVTIFKITKDKYTKNNKQYTLLSLSDIQDEQDKLFESENRYNLITTVSQEGIWDWDVTTNKVDFSTSWKSLHGYKNNEIENSFDQWKKLLHPDDSSNAVDFATKIANGKENKNFSLEHRMLCKDGSYRWFLAIARSIQKDKDGNILRIIGVTIDIQKQKEDAQLILERTKEFKTLFDYSKDPILIMDLEGNFLEMNEAYTDLIGYTKEELFKKSSYDLVHREDLDLYKKAMKETIKKGFHKNLEKRFITKDGSIIQTNRTLSLMPDKKRILVTIKDVTEKNRQNELLANQSKLAELGQMIDAIAHQWKQPLSLISVISSGMAIEIEHKISTEEKILEDLKVIDSQINHLSTTIDEFRLFYRQDTPKSKVILKDEIDKTINLIKTVIIDENINIEFKHIDEIEYKLIPTEFKHVLINLINNAKDAFNDNKIENRKLIFEIIQEKQNILITLHDNAGGIPQNIKDRIFEAHVSSKLDKGGTGIGLHMTKQIVEKLNGTISVDNIDDGAKFIIKLPVTA